MRIDTHAKTLTSSSQSLELSPIIYFIRDKLKKCSLLRLTIYTICFLRCAEEIHHLWLHGLQVKYIKTNYNHILTLIVGIAPMLYHCLVAWRLCYAVITKHSEWFKPFHPLTDHDWPVVTAYLHKHIYCITCPSVGGESECFEHLWSHHWLPDYTDCARSFIYIQ